MSDDRSDIGLIAAAYGSLKDGPSKLASRIDELAKMADRLRELEPLQDETRDRERRIACNRLAVEVWTIAGVVETMIRLAKDDDYAGVSK